MSDFAEGMRVQKELEDATQQHLLQFYEDLSQEEKLDLENDLKNLEIDQLDHMFKGKCIFLAEFVSLLFPFVVEIQLWPDSCPLTLTILMVCSKKMACLAKFLIKFTVLLLVF